MPGGAGVEVDGQKRLSCRDLRAANISLTATPVLVSD
jgi:hypothetical protein